MRKTVMATLGTAGLLLIPLGGLASPAFASGSTLVVGLPDPSAASPACVAPAYLTISSAVLAASSGDTIQVCPGTYNENVSDGGKSLTFQGAQAGVDARTRSAAAESTVNGGGGTAFTLANGSTLDGFTLTGATNAVDTPGVTLSAPNEAVSNTIFTGDNAASIITTNDATFSQNSVVAPANSGNTGYGFFFNSGGGSGSSVTNNAFSGDLSGGAINVADPGAATTGAGGEADGLTIANNTADTSAGGNFAVLGGTTNISITDNTVTGSTSSGTGILLLGDDSAFTIERNNIHNIDASAVSLTGGYQGYPDNGDGTISQNSFKNDRRGINVTSDTGTITAEFNILVGNTANGTTTSPNAAIRNTTTTSTVNASPNFYGCNTGPNTAGCDAVLGTVNDSAWLVLTSSIAQHTLAVGASTTFTANLNHDNNGFGYQCMAPIPCTVLNGEPISFTFDKGTVNPSTSSLVNGQASTTVHKTSSGTGTVTATVDNATSSQTVTDPPPPAYPKITVHDASTTAGKSGSHPLYFSVTLNRKTTVRVTVKYTTGNGTAKAPSDYKAASGVVTFPAGATKERIAVTIVGGKSKTTNKTFAVNIYGATNAGIADSVAEGFIRGNS